MILASLNSTQVSWIVAASALVLAWLLIGRGRQVALALVALSDRRAPRDPLTGVLQGAEPIALGPPGSSGVVLMVHGFIGAGSNFGELPEQLARQGWRVVAPRLPGHGTSPADLESISPQEMIDSVRTQLRALRAEHEHVVVVGHSLGGALGVLAVAEEGASALVLGAPFFSIAKPWWIPIPISPETAFDWLRTPRWLRWFYKGKLFMQLKRREAASEILSYEWVPTKGIATLIELGRRAGDPSVLRRIQCPVLWLHAPSDAAADYASARIAFESLEHSICPPHLHVRLPDSNHQIFFDHDRQTVIASILAFLAPLSKGIQSSQSAQIADWTSS